MGQQVIKCSVNSCYYYASGNKCAASEILVRNDQELLDGKNARYEVGAIGGETDEARRSNQTCCETFVPEQHGPKNGISRLSGV